MQLFVLVTGLAWAIGNMRREECEEDGGEGGLATRKEAVPQSMVNCDKRKHPHKCTESRDK